MKTIFKFEIPFMGEKFSLRIPFWAELLHVQTQGDHSFVWVLLDSLETEANVMRDFIVYGTGDKVDESLALEHVGTWQECNGALVWHLFEIKNKGGK